MEDKLLNYNGLNKNFFNTTRLPLSRIARTCLDEIPLDPPNEQTLLEGIIPHLEFSLEISSNNLTFGGNEYTPYQQFLYLLIKSLHDQGYGYRRIAHKLNKWNVKTTRGKTWFNTSVSSVLKRKHERDVRIQEIRNQEYPIKVGKLSVKYYTY